ncbi:hypothetical protein Q0S28_18840 [Escherichia coli O166:H16]|uniref:hypothetical protein n=1 Tax=Escherichia coli TaxID=562 RepID=UPI000BE58DAA|nr:hypothetical protein [Escherichia coli]EGN4499514.1 hypothetical protein [Escherichia coli]HEB5724185.1 hypothetical protein [Escherichia coli]HEB9046885.1 hypothetical protein [Escherichia coli]
MNKKEPKDLAEGSRAHRSIPSNTATTSKGVWRLSDEEIAELRRDMTEASAWGRAELARRRSQK